MKISIFGSCRQHSISNHFLTTNIQEQLTYPHYTKEIIQAIDFCNGVHYDNTQYMFRTGILQNRPIYNQEELMKEYNESDVIVVEIASRIVYKWNNIYVHHILTESEYGFDQREQIIQYIQTNDEIEQDLLKIKTLVYPKKLLVVSHIYTYNYGKRYNLVTLLEQLCLKYNIQFLSPSEYMANEKDVYVNESVLSHYTEKGHHIIGKLYRSIIENIYKTKTIVFVVKQSYFNHPQTDSANFWGIGDIIRSLYGMYTYTKRHGYNYIIDISNHPLSQFIVCYNHIYSTYVKENHVNIPLIVEEDLNSYLESHFELNDVVCIGAHLRLHAYESCEHIDERKQFIKRHIQPTSEFMSFFNKQISNISLPINIIHYRLGDDELIRNILCTNMNIYYNQLMEQDISHCILLSDSKIFKEYVKERCPSIIQFEHEIGHIGYDTSYNKLKNTFFEFILLQYAKSITSFSVYSWTSGFVSSIHYLYDIPLQSYTSI